MYHKMLGIATLCIYNCANVGTFLQVLASLRLAPLNCLSNVLSFLLTMAFPLQGGTALVTRLPRVYNCACFNLRSASSDTSGTWCIACRRLICWCTVLTFSEGCLSWLYRAVCPPPSTILPSTQPRQQEIHRGEQLNQKKSLAPFSKVI